MKISLALSVVCIMIISSCAPSNSAIQSAIFKTQTVEAEMEFRVQTSIAQTKIAEPTSTPEPTPTATPTQKPTKKALDNPTPNNGQSLTAIASTQQARIPTKAVATTIPIPPTQANPVLDITLKVFNQCSVQHTVVMNGPVRLKFVVNPGQTVEWQGARGRYTWTVDGIYDGTQDLWVAVWTLTLCY